MGAFLGFIMEVIVATLLLATIAYCMIVNRKLEKLRADQENLKSIIRDLNQSTLHAEAAAGELRQTVNKASKELSEQITRAEVSNLSLRKQNDNADGLLDKLTAASRVARERIEPPGTEQFTPGRSFPLEGLVQQEPPRTVQQETHKENLWPQLKLSNLSTNGIPEQETASPSSNSDKPATRSRFQWES